MKDDPTLSEMAESPPAHSVVEPKFVLAALRQNLGGTVHTPDGVDLTEPTGEIWDAECS
jgi:hypothetical protein